MDGDGLFDDFGPEEFGMALGFGEEVGLGEQEDREAQRQNEPEEDLEPMSLKDYKLPRGKIVRAKPAPRGSFEEWVRRVIDGEIDPHDTDEYPIFNDPM